MRAAFGLVALMIGVGLLVWLWSTHTQAVIQRSRPAEDQSKPMTENPTPSPSADPLAQTKQIQWEADSRGLVVKNIGPDNPMARYWGLRAGDRIIQAGDVQLKGEGTKDAEPFVQQAYTYQRELIIDRQGQRMQLNFQK